MRNSCNCVYIDHLCFSSLSPFLMPILCTYLLVFTLCAVHVFRNRFGLKKTNGDENNKLRYKMRNKFAIETELDTNFNCVASVLQSAEG